MRFAPNTPIALSLLVASSVFSACQDDRSYSQGRADSGEIDAASGHVETSDTQVPRGEAGLSGPAPSFPPSFDASLPPQPDGASPFDASAAPALDGSDGTSRPPVTSVLDGAAGACSGPCPDAAACGGNCSPECVEDEDCAATGSECSQAWCNGGQCAVEMVRKGVRCGQPTEECSAPDTCDGEGSCLPNHLPNGEDCSSGACFNGKCLTCSRDEDCTPSSVCMVGRCEGDRCAESPGPSGEKCGDEATTCSAQDTCDSDGKCAANHLTSGVQLPAGEQLPGDCKVKQCDGAGGIEQSALDNDLPSRTAPACKRFVCNAGVAETAPLTDGTPCEEGVCAGGECVQCLSSAQCPPSSNECKQAACEDHQCVEVAKSPSTSCGSSATTCSGQDTCDDSGTCRPNHTAAGAPLPTGEQVSGDCRVKECDGSGGVREVALNSDVQAGAPPQCKSYSCSSGDNVTTSVPDETTCNGGVCSMGACVECVSVSQCPAATETCMQAACRDNQCVQVPASETVGCDDGNYCTVEDHCDGAGSCAGSSRSCAVDTSCSESLDPCACTAAGKLVASGCGDDNTESMSRAEHAARTACAACSGSPGYDKRQASSGVNCWEFYCKSY